MASPNEIYCKDSAGCGVRKRLVKEGGKVPGSSELVTKRLEPFQATFLSRMVVFHQVDRNLEFFPLWHEFALKSSISLIIYVRSYNVSPDFLKTQYSTF